MKIFSMNLPSPGESSSFKTALDIVVHVYPDEQLLVKYAEKWISEFDQIIIRDMKIDYYANSICLYEYIKGYDFFVVGVSSRFIFFEDEDKSIKLILNEKFESTSIFEEKFIMEEISELAVQTDLFDGFMF